MQANETAHDGESEARSLVGPVVGGAGLKEGRAEAGEVGGRDADAGVGADVLLLALGELGENGIMDRAGFVKLDRAPEAQEAGRHLLFQLARIPAGWVSLLGLLAALLTC